MRRILLGLLAAAVLACGQTSSQQEQERKDAEVKAENERQAREAREKDARNDTFRRSTPARIDGKVLMSGGGPPPALVAVHAVCGGQTLGRTGTNEKGEFGMTLGTSVATDSSVGLPGMAGGMVTGPVDCEVHAMLPGFQSTPASVSSRISPIGMRNVTIVLHPIEKVTGYTFSATSLTAPKEARKALQKAAKAIARKKLDEAERELRRAVDLHPKYAVAWYELGRVLLQTNRAADAKHAFEQSAASDPKYISPYPLLAQIAFNERQWEELARASATVIKLNPFFSADIYVFSAQANLTLGRLDLAAQHAREAVDMDKEHKLPVAHRLLGRILAAQGDVKGAIEQLQLFLKYAPPGPQSDAARTELAALSPAPVR